MTLHSGSGTDWEEMDNLRLIQLSEPRWLASYIDLENFNLQQVFLTKEMKGSKKMIWQREAVHKQQVLFKDKSDPSKIIKPSLDTLWRQRRNDRKLIISMTSLILLNHSLFGLSAVLLQNTNQSGNLFVMPLRW